MNPLLEDSFIKFVQHYLKQDQCMKRKNAKSLTKFANALRN